jgi:hypothetical protein
MSDILYGTPTEDQEQIAPKTNGAPLMTEYRSPLEDIPVLDDFVAEAKRNGASGPKLYEAIDFWEEESRKAQELEFNRPEQWRQNQKYSSIVQEDAKKARQQAFDSVTEDILGSTFGADPVKRNEFIKELNANGLDDSKYSDAFKPTAKQISEAHKAARIPLGTTGVVGNVSDQNGRPVADFGLTVDSSGDFRSATVFINDMGLQGESKGIASGDTVYFPKNFNSLEYLKAQQTKERENMLELLSSLPDAQAGDTEYFSQESSNQSYIDRLTKAEAILDKIDNGTEAEKNRLKYDAASSYIQDHVANRVKNGDAKYRDVGLDLPDSIKATVYNYPERFLNSMQAGVATIGSSVTEGVADVMFEGPAKESVEGAGKYFNDFLDDAGEINNNIQARGTFSRLGTYKPQLASALEQSTNAVVQGVALAGTFAAGGVAGNTSIFADSMGSKMMELEEREKALRAKQDFAAADHLAKNKKALAWRAAVYEVLFEKLSPAHDATRAFKGSEIGARNAARTALTELPKEGAEEIAVNTAGAIDELATGTVNEQEFFARMQENPQAFALGMVGAVGPVGARAAIASMYRGSQAKGEAREMSANKIIAARQAEEAAFNERMNQFNNDAGTGSNAERERYTSSSAPTTPTAAAEGSRSTAAVNDPNSSVVVSGIEEQDQSTAARVDSKAQAIIQNTRNVSVTEEDSTLVEEKTQIDEALKAMNDAENQPTSGDIGAVDIVSQETNPLPQTKKKQFEQRVFLESVRSFATKAITEQGASGVSIAGNFVRDMPEIPADANLMFVYPQGHPIEFQESIQNKIIQDKIKSGKAKNPEEAIEQMREEGYSGTPTAEYNNPMIEEVKRRAIVVGNPKGQVMTIGHNDLRKLIEDGYVDPENTYIWFEQMIDPTPAEMESQNALFEYFNETNWVNFRPSAITAIDGNGVADQSKANDQLFLKGTGYGLDTVTLGGKTVGAENQEAYIGLDDILANEGVTTEEREGMVMVPDPNNYTTDNYIQKKMNTTFIAKKDHPKVIKALDKRFGKGNWILKPDNQSRRAGVIRAWSPENFTSDGQFSQDIPVDRSYFYIAQERIGSVTESFRLDTRVSQDGNVVMVPNGIKMSRFGSEDRNKDGTVKDEASGSGWHTFGDLVVPTNIRNAVVPFLERLKDTAYAKNPGSLYGFDMVMTKNGLRVLESNVATDNGLSGGLDMYGMTMNGLAHSVKGTYSPETLATISAYYQVLGQQAIADRIFDMALSRQQVTNNELPEAADLFARKILFKAEETNDQINSAETQFIKDLGLTETKTTTATKPKKQSRTVRQVLGDIAASTDPEIAKYYKELARDLLKKAAKGNSRGLDMEVYLHPEYNSYHTPYANGAGGFLTITSTGISNPLHEMIHALTDAKLPQELSAYLMQGTRGVRGVSTSRRGVTGEEYLTVLENYMNNHEANPFLKEVINDYINAVIALGMKNTVFGKGQLKTGQRYIKDNPGYDYGFSSLDEFITESLTNPQFVRKLANIPSATNRGYIRRLFNSLMTWLKRELLSAGAPANNAWNKIYNDIMMFVEQDDMPSNTWEAAALRVQNSRHYTDLFNDRITEPGSKRSVTEHVWDRLQWRTADQWNSAERTGKIFNLTIASNGTVPRASLEAKVKKSDSSPYEKAVLLKLIKSDDDMRESGRSSVYAIRDTLNALKAITILPLGIDAVHHQTEKAKILAGVSHKFDTYGHDFAIEENNYDIFFVINTSENDNIIIKQNQGIADVASKIQSLIFSTNDEAKRIAETMMSFTTEDYESYNSKSVRSATSKYGVNPYDMQTLKGRVDVAPGQKITWAGDLVLQFQGSVYNYGWAQGLTAEANQSTGRHHVGNDSVSQLAFTRGALHTFLPGAKLPDGSEAKGYERVFEVWEVQSDWMNNLNSEIKQIEREYNNLEEGKDDVIDIDTESSVKLISSSILSYLKNWGYVGDSIPSKDEAVKFFQSKIDSIPHLKAWKTQALKATMIHAQRLGATHIALLDGSTVAMFEGHEFIDDNHRRERIIAGVKKNYDGDYVDALRKLTGNTPKKVTMQKDNSSLEISSYNPDGTRKDAEFDYDKTGVMFELNNMHMLPKLSVTEPDILPYRNKRVQKGFASETSNDIVPLFDIYEIELPGTMFHQSTITVKTGSTHDEIMEYIDKKYRDAGQGPLPRMSAARAKAKLPKKVVIGDFKINPKFLTDEQQLNLESLRKRLAAGEKIPSVMLEEQLNQFKKDAELGEFNMLRQAYPEAFSKKNKAWDEFTTLADAENTLVDWLFDNPKKLSQPDIFGDSDKQQDVRKGLVKSFTAYIDLMEERMEAGELQRFFEHNPVVQERIDKALDFIINNYDPKALSDRQLTALNMAMKTFLDSDGYNIRGFSKLASQIEVSSNVEKLKEVSDKLSADGVTNPWGDPVSDFRRGFVSDSKTGSSIADHAIEITAIFHRPETRRVWSDIFAEYRIGIDSYKIQAKELRDEFNEKIRQQGNTTKLNDYRIGIVLQATQYEQTPGVDPTPQLLRNISEITESIKRKESSINRRDQREAAIERAAYDMLIAPMMPAIQAGMPYDVITQTMEAALTAQEKALVEIAREPGRRYYAQLDGINQVARGKAIQNWVNYVKRSQFKLNNEGMTKHWGADAIQSADSVLQPREGLANDAAFSFNWRANLDWQLEETAYELNTGVPRIMMFDMLKDDAFAQVMDGRDSTRQRTKRMQAQIGGVHANIKNREIRFGFLASGALEAAKLSIAMKLATIKAPFNQMIPLFVHGINNTRNLAETVFYRLMPSNKKKSDEFLGKHSLDLVNRMKQWDTLIDRFQVGDRMKKSGIKTGAASVTESALVGLEKIAHAMRVGAQELVSLPITLTNGISEVYAARTVFFGLYAQQLQDRGIISSVSDMYAGRSIPFDRNAMAQAELEFDSFVMSPTNPEFRSEYAQRNSNAKIASNLMLTGLMRTASQQSLKSITSLRDLSEATLDYMSNPTASNKAFLADAARETEKQILNIALYYGIAYAISNQIGGVMSTAFFTAAANLAGDDDEREKWMRRMRNLEKINKEMQTKYMKQQLAVDTLFAVVPWPAVLQSNPGRELFNIALTGFMLDDRPAEAYDIELKQLRDYRDQMNGLLALDMATSSGNYISEAEFNRINAAVEIVEYGIAKLEEERDAKKNYIKSSVTNIGRSMTPLPDGNKVISSGEDYVSQVVPDWVEDTFVSKPEKARRTDKELERVRTGYEWWAFAAFFNASKPALKAAKQMTKEYTDDKVTKEMKMEEDVREIESILGN